MICSNVLFKVNGTSA